MARGIDVSERLFNLTCALVSSRRGLTKNEIFNTVHGYLEDGTTTHNLKTVQLEALDKLFERDKSDLLASGIQLIGGIPPEAMDDNTEYRYTIPRESMAWPSDLKLTPRQVALLNLAASVWSQASLSSETSRAVMRLRALGEKPEETGLFGIAPGIRTHGRAFLPLTDAIADGEIVEFEYRKANEKTSEKRKVQPWLLQNISGQWLVVCWDLKRNAVRNFLLKRIVSKVTTTGEKFEKPTAVEIDAAVSELNDLISDQVASIRIKPDSEAWIHFELPDSSDGEHEIHYMDLYLLADQLREYIHDIEAIRPQNLADAVDAGLQQVASDHHA